MPDIGLISLPFILLITVIEAVINHVDHLNLHERKDSLINLFLGVILILVGVGLKLVARGFFQWVYQFRIFEFDHSWWVWLTGLLCCDFSFYWFHRLGHTCRLFWANHVVHHSSPNYNYTVGIRNHFMHLTYRFLFWAPLCWIGFDPFLVVFIDNCTSLYQFFLHTQLIGKLGPLEWILNTPSHHRVHHGSNEKYIDKNFGGLLIIYDQLFGTFCKETEPPRFGITKKIENNNPVKIAFHEYYELITCLKRRGSIMLKLKFLFSNPASGEQIGSGRKTLQ